MAIAIAHQPANGACIRSSLTPSSQCIASQECRVAFFCENWPRKAELLAGGSDREPLEANQLGGPLAVAQAVRPNAVEDGLRPLQRHDRLPVPPRRLRPGDGARVGGGGLPQGGGQEAVHHHRRRHTGTGKVPRTERAGRRLSRNVFRGGKGRREHTPCPPPQCVPQRVSRCKPGQQLPREAFQ